MAQSSGVVLFSGLETHPDTFPSLLKQGVDGNNVLKVFQCLLLLFWIKCCGSVGVFFCLFVIPVIMKEKIIV